MKVYCLIFKKEFKFIPNIKKSTSDNQVIEIARVLVDVIQSNQIETKKQPITNFMKSSGSTSGAISYVKGFSGLPTYTNKYLGSATSQGHYAELRETATFNGNLKSQWFFVAGTAFSVITAVVGVIGSLGFLTGLGAVFTGGFVAKLVSDFNLSKYYVQWVSKKSTMIYNQGWYLAEKLQSWNVWTGGANYTHENSSPWASENYYNNGACFNIGLQNFINANY